LEAYRGEWEKQVADEGRVDEGIGA